MTIDKLAKKIKNELELHFSMRDDREKKYNELVNKKRYNKEYLLQEKENMESITYDDTRKLTKEVIPRLLQEHLNTLKPNEDIINSQLYQTKLNNALMLLSLGADAKTIPFLREIEEAKDQALINILVDKYNITLKDKIQEEYDKCNRLAHSTITMIDSEVSNRNNPLCGRDIIYSTLDNVTNKYI